MITATGWSWEYVDDREFPQVISLFKYWGREPPIHRLMKYVFMGKRAEDKPQTLSSMEEIQRVVATYGKVG